MKEITIDTIREVRENNPQVIELIDLARTMNDKQLSLLIEVLTLCDGHPERYDFAASWTGKPDMLPAALAQI